MRQVSRLAYRTRNLRRRRPQPRWQHLLIRTGNVVLPVVALSWGLWTAWHLPTVQNALERLEERAIQISEDAGLKLQDVYAEGRVHTSQEELREALAPFFGKSLLTLDLEQARERIEALPWVRSASVERRMPDRLDARLTEYRPLALWRQDGQTWLVDVSGDAVVIDDLRAFADLPILFGDEAPKHARALFNMLASEPTLARRVTGATLHRSARWSVFLDGRLAVQLPAAEPEAAWHRLAMAQEQDDLLARAIDSIDLRVPDRLIVRLLDASSLQTGGRV